MAKRERTSNEPQEWQDGQAAAREAREVVAGQLSALVVDRDITGDRSLLARRLRELLVAEGTEDATLIRAAAMEVAHAGAAWCVAMDLRQRWVERTRATRYGAGS